MANFGDYTEKFHTGRFTPKSGVSGRADSTVKSRTKKGKNEARMRMRSISRHLD